MIYKVLDRENLTVTTAVKQFTAAKVVGDLMYAIVQVQGQAIRATVDGSTPNPSTPLGTIYLPYDIFEVWGHTACKNFKMYREGGVDAKVEVTYMGR